MAAQIAMIFWRDTDPGPGCLEYSWVPTGQRRVVRLGPLQDEESRQDSVSDEISHVQVYRLVCNRYGLDTWQFPQGPPHNSRIIFATIQVFESRMYVVGTAHYADGSSATDFRSLKADPLPCPELPES